MLSSFSLLRLRRRKKRATRSRCFEGVSFSWLSPKLFSRLKVAVGKERGLEVLFCAKRRAPGKGGREWREKEIGALAVVELKIVSEDRSNASITFRSSFSFLLSLVSGCLNPPRI